MPLFGSQLTVIGNIGLIEPNQLFGNQIILSYGIQLHSPLLSPLITLGCLEAPILLSLPIADEFSLGGLGVCSWIVY